MDVYILKPVVELIACLDHPDVNEPDVNVERTGVVLEDEVKCHEPPFNKNIPNVASKHLSLCATNSVVVITKILGGLSRERLVDFSHSAGP
jgi:hypothetical protein